MQRIGGRHAHSQFDAEVEMLVRALRSYGVLTRDRLAEAAHADHWTGPIFEMALAQGVAERRIKRLGDGLYELGESERDAAA